MKTHFNRFYQLLFVIFALWNIGYAQPEPMVEDTYRFINYKVDTLYFNKKPSTHKGSIENKDSLNAILQTFITKFDSVATHKSGNINILHIGASHVQAGTFPHTVRQNLLRLYPDLQAGRGMIFPYSAAPKCNNPIDYRTRSVGRFGLIRNVYKEHQKPLGITGIAIYTLDSVSEIRIVPCDSLKKFKTTKITLLGYCMEDSTFLPVLNVNSVDYLPSTIIPKKRQFIYENICVTDSFTFSLTTKGSSSFTITGILLENENPGITYHSIGVNGASVNAFLRCEHFEEEIILLSPDMVIFGLGINDANEPDFTPNTFKENYLKLVAQFRKVNPNIFFVFITNNDSYKKVGKKYEVNVKAVEVRKIFYELADETDGAVFDQFEIMGGLHSIEKWRGAKLAQNDRIHFTKEGYELMGKLLFNALIKFVETQRAAFLH